MTQSRSPNSPWKIKPYNINPPFGYVRYETYKTFLPERSVDPSEIVGDPETWVYPDYTILDPLTECLDQLDNGIPLRRAADWLNENLPEGVSLSHTSLNNIRKRERPDFKRKLILPSPTKIKMTREERILYNKKNKLKKERLKLSATLKRVKKREQELNPNSIDPVVEVSSPSVVSGESFDSGEIITPEVKPIFSPNPGPQSAFLAAPEMEVLYGGAAGGGKSYALLADPVRYFSNPNFNGLLVRRTNDELRELIWNSHELYKAIYPDAKWSERKSSWKFPAGGNMWFTYLERDEDVMRYQGQAFTWIGFDELTQYPTQFPWVYLRSRLRSTDPELKKTLSMRATTNPGGPGHGWVKKMFIDPALPGTAFPATDLETGEPLVFPEKHARAGEPLFYRKFIPAKVSDNPYLWADGMYEANLLSLPENQRRMLLDGDWDVADGAAFSEFRRSIHTCDPFEIPRDWMRFRSCDFGYSERQASAVHWYAVDPRFGTLYVYRELYVNKHTGIQLAQKVLELERGERISYGVLDSSVWSVRGQTGPSIAEEMIRAGCKWKPSDRSKGSRVASKNRLHELLRVETHRNGEKRPGIIFFNTCKQIITDLPVIPSDKDSDDIDPKFASDHAYDSIRYGIQTRPKQGYSPFAMASFKKETIHRASDPKFGY